MNNVKACAGVQALFLASLIILIVGNVIADGLTTDKITDTVHVCRFYKSLRELVLCWLGISVRGIRDCEPLPLYDWNQPKTTCLPS